MSNAPLMPLENPASIAAPPGGRWTGRVAVTGIGLVTPVGLNAPAGVAAMRAGVSRIAELPDFEIPGPDGPVPVTGAQVPRLPGNRHGPARLLRLAEPALREAAADAKLPRTARCALFVGTAAPHSGGHVLDHNRPLLDGLSRALRDVSGSDHVQLVPVGRAAALRALRAGILALERGTVDVAIVGGVDSWVGPRALFRLHDGKRLRDGEKAAGVLPGEGAGFVVLERPDAAARRGAAVRAVIAGAAGEEELIPFGEPSRAAALAHVFQAMPVPPADADARSIVVVSDLNGERPRAFEWTFASIRAGWCHSGTPHWHPGESIGDAGAASGAACLAWAVTALARGYARARNVVVWGASDEGARESVLLQPAANGNGSGAAATRFSMR